MRIPPPSSSSSSWCRAGLALLGRLDLLGCLLRELGRLLRDLGRLYGLLGRGRGRSCLGVGARIGPCHILVVLVPPRIVPSFLPLFCGWSFVPFLFSSLLLSWAGLLTCLGGLSLQLAFTAPASP